MFAKEQVSVIRKHRTRVARIVLRPCHLAKRLADGLPFGGIKPEHFVLQHLLGSPLKASQLLARRLIPLSPVMNLTKLRKRRGFHFARETSAYVVRQPVAIAGENEMVGDYNVW